MNCTICGKPKQQLFTSTYCPSCGDDAEGVWYSGLDPKLLNVGDVWEVPNTATFICRSLDELADALHKCDLDTGKYRPARVEPLSEILDCDFGAGVEAKGVHKIRVLEYIKDAGP